MNDFLGERLKAESEQRCALHEMRGYISHMLALGFANYPAADILHLGKKIDCVLGLLPTISEVTND